MNDLSELSGVLARLTPYETRGRALLAEMRAFLAALARHDRLGPDGPLLILLFGGANTGKSSLFNTLVGQDLSIAHAIAGSTRHLLVHGSPAVAKALSDPALWPEPYRPVPFEKREALEEDISPRRVYVSSSADAGPNVIIDSPDITTAHAENAALTQQALLACDVVLLVLTDEQHADRVLVDRFPEIRDLAKHPLVVFNRATAAQPEEAGAYQKFRTLWLENKMGGIPEKFFLPRLAPVRVAQQLSKEPAFLALRDHLANLDRRRLRDQTQAGLIVAMRERGRALVIELGEERKRVSAARAELTARYRALVIDYNSRRRWASRMLQVRSWLQSTFGGMNPTTTPQEDQATEIKQRQFWQLILTPLMGADDRPTALEGLELMAEALETDPAPAPLFRPFTRMYSGMSSLIFGPPAAGREGDAPSLLDALELLEKTRCGFVAHESLPKTLGVDWRGAMPHTSALDVDPKHALDAIAEEYRQICEDLKTNIRDLLAKDPGVRERLSRRHAQLALTAGIALALALIDGGHSALAVGAGLGAPVLWELMDWAANQPALNTALYAFEHKKAKWLERAFQRHVTGPLWDSLVTMEEKLDAGALEMALRHGGLEKPHA